MTQTNDLIIEWCKIGPVAWCEGPFGWITDDGKSIHLEAWQRAALAAWWEHRATVSTFAISCIKKSGKTTLDAILTAWRWLSMPGLHYCAANDLDQAQSLQFLMIAEMCKRNEYLRDNTTIGKTQLVFNPTGSTLTALAGDYAGAAGGNFLTVSHTESWGVQYENAVRLWEELTPVPGRFYGLPCLRIADSYAGYSTESKTWHDLVDRGLHDGKRIDKHWGIYLAGELLLFHEAGQEAQERCFRGTPEERKAYYKEQRRTLRSNTYLRLHENQRTANVGNFCQQEDWEALINSELKPLAPNKSVPIYIGLDLAVAPGGDNCALIGIYKKDGKVVTAFHKLWKGALRIKRLSLINDVGPYILKLARDYKIAGVYFDPWQAIALAELLRKAGVNCVEVNQGRSSRGPKDTALYEMVSNGELVLYDDDDLRYAPGGANAKELGNGQIFLTKAGGRAKIDLLVALSNCASECNTGAGSFEVWTSDDPFDWAMPDSDGPLEFHGIDGWTRPWHEHHSPGATSWRDCRYRNSGCKQCEVESKADEPEGEYFNMPGDEDLTPREAFLQSDLGQRLIREAERAAVDDDNRARTLELFWKDVKEHKK